MPPLQPEHYVPAFGFLLLIGGGLVTTIKVLYSRNIVLVDKLHEFNSTVASEAIKAILLGTVATNDHSKGIERFTRTFDEFARHYEAERRLRARNRGREQSE